MSTHLRARCSLHRPSPRALTAFAALLSLAVSVGASACASAKPGAAGPVVPTRELTSWAGVEKEMLDDSLDLGAIILDDTSISDVNDAALMKLDSRTAVSDGVLKVKIIGASAESVGGTNRYRIEFAQVGAPLHGAAFPPPIMILVPQSAPIYATLKAADARLPGQILVIFYRRYAPMQADDEPVVHFHITAASAKVIKEITDDTQRHEVIGS